ncbi:MULTISPECIES: Ig-like domain-containing protein [unclassified Leucobacter]|uniref:Ig-like domain-containing protein n=3 Tax=Leucobacter TaxID=55968 RepID=UPI0013041477|nr:MULTISPECIES: Ig-like domain-containing protein [unclassified Leucobacter]
MLRPRITGTGQPNATITVREGDTVLGTTTVGANGEWSLTPEKYLAEGPHTIVAEQNVSGQPSSATHSFTIRFAPVVFPAATVDSKRPTLTGTGQPGATIEITDKDGKSVGSATVAEDGTWSLIPSVDLAKGPNALTAVQISKGGGDTSEAAATITVKVIDELTVTGPKAGTTVDTDKPVVTGVSEPKADITITDTDGKVIGSTTANGTGEWSVTLPAQPNGRVEITVTDEHGQEVDHAFDVDVAPAIADLVLTGPKEGATVDTDTPKVTGTAEPGAKVTVTGKDGEVLAETTAGEDGKWSVELPKLPNGTHEIAATDDSGQSDDVSFAVNAIAPIVLTGPESSESKRPAVTGTGHPGSNVELKDVLGKTIGIGSVGTDGTWSITPSVDLGKGSNVVTAHQTAPGGKASQATGAIQVTAKDALVVTGPAPGSTVESETPVVSGTTEPGAKVTVTGPDGKLGETVADENGDWSIELPVMPEGETSLTVTDEHGGKVEIDFTVPAHFDDEQNGSAQADPGASANSNDRANANAAASAAATAKADDNSNASAQAAAKAAAYSDATSEASAAADISAEAAAKAAATPTASSNTTANLTSASNSAAEAAARAAAQADNSSSANASASQRATMNANAASKAAAIASASANSSSNAGANGSDQPKWKRLGGANRYQTAVVTSKDSYPRGASSVIIARSDLAPDALSAAPFAAKMSAPVLLTPPTALVGETKAEITRLEAKTVYIAGGTGAISASVEAEIKRMGVKIVRMAGSDRYATSLKIAETGWKSGSERAFVATGRDYPDALSAGSAAGATGVPVILVDGKLSALNSTSRAALAKYGTKNLYIAGGTGVVSTGVESSMRGGGKTVERFAGGTRYETSAAIAKEWHTKGGLVYLATGVDFPDALAGSAVAGAQAAPIMLTQKNCVPKPVKDAITNTIKPQRGYVLGGTGVITDRVLNSQPSC